MQFAKSVLMHCLKDRKFNAEMPAPCNNAIGEVRADVKD